MSVAAGTTSFALRVYYEDTDASGVVYHASYLRFFERARTEWLRAQGFGQEQLRSESALAFTVASLQIDFRRPARLDDELRIETVVQAVRRASLVFAQTLLRHADGEVLSEAQVRVACVAAADFRLLPLPRDLFAHLAPVVGQGPAFKK